MKIVRAIDNGTRIKRNCWTKKDIMKDLLYTGKSTVLRLFGFGSVVIMVTSVAFPQVKLKNNNTVKGFDGVYEFVSRTSSFSEPTIRRESETSEDWKGIWIFCNGYFSRTLDKKFIVKDFDLKKQSPKFEGIELSKTYTSTTGKYELESNFISFSFPISQSLVSILPEVAEFTLKDRILTLRQTFTPDIYDNMRGEIITTLKRTR